MHEAGRRAPIHLPPCLGAGQPTIIFLTVCTKERRPLLASPEMHNHLREAWSDSSRWLVGRYMILPDHLHLFCSPLADCNIPLERWVAFWKNAVARKWKATQKTPETLWQKEFWDRRLRADESYNQKWDYVRNNPVRHGLCQKTEDWPHQGEIQELRM
jgi:REP element-mobilizing transposase RayT